jgi:hypothetical protein
VTADIPWKSMLTFGVAAGPVRNKAELQKFFEIITERLQRRYDIEPEHRNYHCQVVWRKARWIGVAFH